MTLNLTQKERTLLQDQKGHEEVCIKKYNDYAQKTQDPQLKQLFTNYASIEQEHLSTINQMLSGQVPQTNQQQGQQQGQQGQQQGQQGMSQGTSSMASTEDKALCQDMLMTEKYVSSAYNNAILEANDKNVRQTLNHIQKEEQEHAEGIYNYMKNNGMYNPQ